MVSYTIIIRNPDDNYETSLEVSVGIINNIYITTTSEDIEGEVINRYETFKEEANMLSDFCEEYPGILLIKYYKTITYSNLYKTCYSINYDKDSIEYKLFSLFVNDTKNIYEAVDFTELLKNKKDNILEIFK